MNISLKMSEIKRYSVASDFSYSMEIPDGKWCKYDDIAPIIQRNTELEAELARLREQEPYAYETYKGYLLHAGDPKVLEHSNPKTLYAEPKPFQEIPAELIEWANNFESVFGTDDEDMVSEKITRNVCREFLCDQLEKMKGGA